ncbi:MAG: radical SAM protein [Vicinamibacterales bacterium]
MASFTDHAYRRLYEGLNYRLRSWAGGRLAGHCRPTFIGFLLTEFCNARCVHCNIWQNRGKEDSPTVAQWNTVLTDLRDWLGPVHVVFTGGEALLRPWALDVVSHAARLGFYVEHLTHGFWDDQSKIERLALSGPSRVTVSLDGVGETHDLVRGKANFFKKASTSIETLQRLQRDRGLRYTVRLKNVLMSHNLHEAERVADFASKPGTEVFYQAIEQNYNTPEDARWFEHSPNWPRDPERAVAVVQRLIALKQDGRHIANSVAQLEAMIPYFRDPDRFRVSIQSHSAHERRALCSALTMLQLQANGDVTVCSGQSPVGNIKSAPVRQIWETRPAYWMSGCCMERRLSEAERDARGVAQSA